MPEPARRTMHPVTPQVPTSRWIAPVAREMEGWPTFDRAPVGNHKHSAAVSALYRFFDADEFLLYVGVTTNPARRWRSHTRTDWWPRTRFVSVEPVPPAQRLERERIAIATEEPLFNRLRPKRPISMRVRFDLADGFTGAVEHLKRQLPPEEFALFAQAVMGAQEQPAQTPHGAQA